VSQRRTQAERRGRRGEALTAAWLMLTGWRIAGRRVRTPRGEIDIIARRGKTVCFIEVKWRRAKADLGRAITPQGLRRVAAAAEAVAHRHARPGDTLRIDVVLIAPGCWPKRIENAWQPGVGAGFP
jgi:Predicted endonuclease distantly related to archaeal Holliday junction resolvase